MGTGLESLRFSLLTAVNDYWNSMALTRALTTEQTLKTPEEVEAHREGSPEDIAAAKMLTLIHSGSEPEHIRLLYCCVPGVYYPHPVCVDATTSEGLMLDTLILSVIPFNRAGYTLKYYTDGYGNMFLANGERSNDRIWKLDDLLGRIR